MPDIRIDFSKKMPSFLALGIILYFGSTYLNILKENIATLGQVLGIIIIIIAFIVQIISWYRYFRKK